MFRKMLLGVAALILLSAAPAAAQYNITVTPDTLEPGGVATVTGEGCAPGADVTVTLTQISAQRAIGEPIEVGSGQANEDGEYAVDIEIPADADPGVYEISVFCDGAFVESAQITVAGPGTPTTQPPAGGGDDDIVRTGSDLDGLGLLGAGLLVGGGIVLFATRNRRHATS